MIEAMKQWLEALEMVQADVKTTPNAYETQRQAVASLRQVIAELEKQEPVAFASHGVVNWIADKQFQHEADLYTHPQPKQKPLTDEQRSWIVATCPTPRHIIDTVEKMLGIKENT